MLNRITDAGKRIRLPRRGRIRIALTGIIVATGIWLYHGQSAAHTEKTASDGSALSELKRSRIFGAPIKPERLITREDLAAYFKIHTPDLHASIDTLDIKGKQSIVYFSLDTTLQDAIARLFLQYHPKYGAAVAIDPATGRILGLVDYTHPDEPSRGEHLYLQSWYPSASIFKIITAAGAIELGRFTAESKIRIIGRNHTLYRSQLVDNPGSFREIPLEEAYALSVNPAFGRLGIYVLGASGLQTYIDRFGFNTPIPFELENQASRAAVIDSPFALAELASGFNKRTCISPLFGALLASAIVEKGRIPIPTIVDSVVDFVSGKKMYAADHETWRTALGERSAAEVRYLMTKVAQYGTARRSYASIRRSASFEDMEYGGKTGTIDKDSVGRIDWYVGFARNQRDLSMGIAFGIVTVHGAFWTVHSSLIGSEISRIYLRSAQHARKEAAAAASLASLERSHEREHD